MFFPRAMTRSGLCILLCLSVLSGAGCDNDDETSVLVGKWITQACGQATDGGGMPVDIWVRGIYEFTEQGEILFGQEQYSDSDCVVKEDASNDPMVVAAYLDGGPQMLQEGIPGGGLLITINANIRSLSIDAFYTTFSGPLCFSGAFEFGTSRFGIAEWGSGAIDFNSCLSRFNEQYPG